MHLSQQTLIRYTCIYSLHATMENQQNQHTLALLDQLNQNQNTSTHQVIKPTPVFASKEQAFAHYYATSSLPSNERHRRPRKHFTQHVVPKLTTSASRTRYNYIKNTVQSGSLVHFHGIGNSDLFRAIQISKWEPLVFYRFKFVCMNLVHEFYCNLEIGNGFNNEKFFTTVLNGTSYLINHSVISNALCLSMKITEKPLMDITTEFEFNKEEYQLYLGTFCDSDIPEGNFEKDEGIPFEYFSPMFQNLALIIRSNIFPKPNNDKLFNFLDLKLMFLMLNDKIEFNLSYVILLNMISATQKSFMPYGMLLSSVFSYLKIDVFSCPSLKVSSFISEKTNREQVPLDEYVSVVNPVVNLPSGLADPASVVAKMETFQKKVESELDEMKGMHMRAVYRVNHLLGVVNNLVGKAHMLEQSSDNMFKLIKKLGLGDDTVGTSTGPGNVNVDEAMNVDETVNVEDGDADDEQ